jgi:cytochrome b6-f complex iron-sulfur subunit
VPFEKAFPAANVKEVTLPEAQKLARGSVLTFMFGLKPAMLIHHANGEWSALSAVCTHLGCTVKYEPQHPRIYCSCHGGIYDPSTGANLAGPPPRPLERYTVVVGKESVTVSKG